MRSHIFVTGLLLGSALAPAVRADPLTPPQSEAAPAPATADAAASATKPEAPQQPERTANNALYAEGLGPALLYSINYDRSFGDFAARIGFEYLSISASTPTTAQAGASASASFLAVPLTVSYIGIGSKKNMLELGAGATIFHEGAGGKAFDGSSKSSASESTTFLLPTALVGYRLQPPDGGFFFRVGLSAVFAGSTLPVLPWPYLALGGVFGP